MTANALEGSVAALVSSPVAVKIRWVNRGVDVIEAAVANHGLEGRRILIVEDEFLAADEIAMTLRATGAEIVGAAPTVQKALDMIRSAPALDAVVIDINLSGDMAYPIAEALIARETPFVFATAYRRDQLPERYRQAPHCQKPLQPPILLRELQAALAKGSVQAERHDATEQREVAVAPVAAPAPTDDLGARAAGWIHAIARDGDRQAFGALFLALAPKIKNYMLRFGVTDTVAEELAQEAMLTIWQKSRQFDPELGSATAWVFTIAHNLRIDMFRKEHPGHHRPTDWSDPPTQPTPEQIFGARVDSRRLHEALAELPPDQAILVRRSFMDAETHVEIARSLGLPLGTVKSRLRLAFARMRLKLADEAD